MKEKLGENITNLIVWISYSLWEKDFFWEKRGCDCRYVFEIFKSFVWARAFCNIFTDVASIKFLLTDNKIRFYTKIIPTWYPPAFL